MAVSFSEGFVTFNAGVEILLGAIVPTNYPFDGHELS